VLYHSRGRPRTPFSAALGLTAALGFVVRVSVLCESQSGGPAGARPVESLKLSNKRFSLMCAPAFESSWARRRPLALGQAPCARGLADGYDCIAHLQILLSRRWELPPHTPAFRWARFVLQTARYRGQRSAWQVGAAAPTLMLSAALGLSCWRLATITYELLGSLAGGGCRPHPPRFAFRCARLVLQTARCRQQQTRSRRRRPPQFLASEHE
jgi:hypothetical protein